MMLKELFADQGDQPALLVCMCAYMWMMGRVALPGCVKVLMRLSRHEEAWKARHNLIEGAPAHTPQYARKQSAAVGRYAACGRLPTLRCAWSGGGEFLADFGEWTAVRVAPRPNRFAIRTGPCVLFFCIVADVGGDRTSCSTMAARNRTQSIVPKRWSILCW